MADTLSNTLQQSSETNSYGSLSASIGSERATTQDRERAPMSNTSISAILSIAFSYGCIMTTLFILTLPVECGRIESESSKYYSFNISKSIALGAFAAIAGLAQLVSPIIGLLSDNYVPRSGMKTYGKRLPYLMLGTVACVVGLLGMLFASSPIHPLEIGRPVILSEHDVDAGATYEIGGIPPRTAILGGAWIQYTVYFTVCMLGLNMAYTVMVAMIPQYVPRSQTGVANGTMALMAVSGSLFGFSMFHLCSGTYVILTMYKLYIVVVLISGVLTYYHVCDIENQLIGNGVRKQETRLIGENDEESSITLTKIARIEEAETDEISLSSAYNFTHAILYEPITNMTQDEILASFWIDVSKYRDFFIVTISRFFYYMAISSQTFYLYFIHDALKKSQETENPISAVALLAILGQISGALTCYPAGIISDYYFNGRRKPFVYCACLFLGLCNIALTFCDDFQQVVLLSLFAGASNGMYLTMDTALAVDTLEHDDDGKEGTDEHRDIHRHKDAAQLLGVWGVFGFIGSALGPMTGALVLLTVGNDAPSGHFYSLNGYDTLFTLTAFYYACSASSLAFVRKKGV